MEIVLAIYKQGKDVQEMNFNFDSNKKYKVVMGKRGDGIKHALIKRIEGRQKQLHPMECFMVDKKAFEQLKIIEMANELIEKQIEKQRNDTELYLICEIAKFYLQEKRKELNNGWIPCSSGNFSTSEVLVCREDGTIDFDVFDFMEEDWKFNSKHHKNKAIAWQPLPEPYQPKGKENEQNNNH